MPTPPRRLQFTILPFSASTFHWLQTCFQILFSEAFIHRKKQKRKWKSYATRQNRTTTVRRSLFMTSSKIFFSITCRQGTAFWARAKWCDNSPRTMHSGLLTNIIAPTMPYSLFMEMWSSDGLLHSCNSIRQTQLLPIRFAQVIPKTLQTRLLSRQQCIAHRTLLQTRRHIKHMS